jgi:CyaY protein
MTESQFLRDVEATLAEIEAAFDDADIGADCSLAGLVLTVELDDGGKIVVNAQTPMRQLWLASRSGAMHFVFDGDRWRDLRSGAEFFDALSRAVSEQTGREVRLAPR